MLNISNGIRRTLCILTSILAIYSSRIPATFQPSSEEASLSLSSSFIENGTFQGPTKIGETLDFVIDNFGYDPSDNLIYFKKESNQNYFYKLDCEEWEYNYVDGSLFYSISSSLQTLFGGNFGVKGNLLLRTVLTPYGNLDAIFDSDVPLFVEKLDNIKKFTKNPEERIAIAYGLVRNSMEYKKGFLTTPEAIASGEGCCVNYAEALSFSLNYFGIENSVVGLPMHNRVNVFSNGKSYDLDPTFYEDPKRIEPASDAYFRNLLKEVWVEYYNSPIEPYNPEFRELVP